MKGNQLSKEIKDMTTESNISGSLIADIPSSDFDTEAMPMLTPSEIIKYIYCPRFIYFMHCLKIAQHEELRYKVLKGRELHQKRETTNRDYLRKKLGCVDKHISVYIASRKIGVRGIVDEVLHFEDGTISPLDYKYTEFTEFTYATHRIQSILYALLMEDCYKKKVLKGYICYARSGHMVKKIEYSKEDFVEVLKIIKNVNDIISKGYYPQKTKWPNRCIDCCYKNICV